MNNVGPNTGDSRLNIDHYQAAAARKSDHSYEYKGLHIHAMRGVHEAIADAARSELKPGDEVLDVACGTGALSLRLAELGLKVTGCDAVSDNFGLHGEIPFVGLDLNGPFSEAFPKKFQALVTSEIIEHLENPRHFLRQCANALRPGGTLILTTPNVDSALSRAIWIRTGTFKWFDAQSYRTDGHITPLHIFVLKAALAEVGLRIVTLTSVGTTEGARKWWKMRAFAWLLGAIDGQATPNNEILFLVAQKPSQEGTAPRN